MIGRTKRNGGDLVTRREREVRREGRGGRDVAVRAGARRPQTVRVRPAVVVAVGSVADDVAHGKDGALDEGEREEEQEEKALPRELRTLSLQMLPSDQGNFRAVQGEQLEAGTDGIPKDSQPEHPGEAASPPSEGS